MGLLTLRLPQDLRDDVLVTWGPLGAGGGPALPLPALAVRALPVRALPRGLGAPGAQRAGPIADVAPGTWTPSTGATLYGCLDEATRDDADYIQSAYAPSADTCRLTLTSLTDPGRDTGHTLTYVYRRRSALSPPVDLTVTLYSGATRVAQWTHAAIPATWTVAAQSLAAAEAALIGDYTALALEFVADERVPAAALAAPAAGLTSGPPAPVVTPGAWWRAGGVAADLCFGAYQGKGAASQAASYVNLNAPGTHNLYWSGLLDSVGNPQSEPSWNGASGWVGLGSSRGYFRMAGGWYPTSTAVTWIMQYTDAATFSMQFGGASAGSGGRSAGMSMNNTGSFRDFYNWGEGDVGGTPPTAGNMAVAGKAIFLNGVKSEVSIGAGTGTNLYDWNWGCENWAGEAHGAGPVTVVAMACYNAVLTDAQVAAIAAAMAAL